MKKKIIAIVMMLIMISAVFLSGCGGQQGENADGAESSVAEDTEGAAEAVATETTEDEAAVADDAATDTSPRILTVYFSAGNMNDSDAISGATPLFGDDYSTELAAKYIQEIVGGYIAKIMPTEDYPLEYNATTDKAMEEQNNDERPDFTLDVNPEDYDTIFIGYPVWWYRIPMIMDTFFERYDFSGKTIVPFNTHAGSGTGGTYEIIADYEPDAEVLEGLPLSGTRVDGSREEIEKWIAGLGL